MNEVDAVKTDSQMIQIEAHLTDYPQIYQDIWRFGLNTALRISDLLSIEMQQIKSLDIDSPKIIIIERKTRKSRSILLNSAALTVARRRLCEQPDDVWLFQSSSPAIKTSDPKPLSRRAVSKVLENIGPTVRPRLRLNTHSLRKTRGWRLYKSGYSIERICQILGHSSTKVTLRYIGLTQQDIDESFVELVI